MKRLKGPELKMPDMKAPAFLADVYYDLRDRRLLPLMALVVVAIAAVPFLLGGGSEEVAPPPTAESALAQASGAGIEAGTLTVVEAKPGLRDYRKRLSTRTPKNPFRQQYPGPGALKGAQLPEPTGSTSPPSGADTAGTVTVSGGKGGTAPGTPSSSPPAPDGKADGKPDLVFYAFAISVRITKAGGKNAGKAKKQEPIVRERVLPQTALPGEKTPVVTYMGPARKGDKATGKALLLVSGKVQSVFGETKCVSGDDVCQLIEVEPGFPVTFVYGANEVRYTVNILKLGLVITGRSDLSRPLPQDSQSFSK
jgi:hypothetical protein